MAADLIVLVGAIPEDVCNGPMIDMFRELVPQTGLFCVLTEHPSPVGQQNLWDKQLE